MKNRSRTPFAVVATLALSMAASFALAVPVAADELDGANVELTYKTTRHGKPLDGIAPEKLVVTAPVGSVVAINCSRKGCAARSLITKRRTTTLRGFKAFLPRGTAVVVRVSKEGSEGVRIAYTVRKGGIKKTRKRIPLPAVPTPEVPPVPEVPVVETPPVEKPPEVPLNLGPDPIGKVELGSGTNNYLQLVGWTLDPDDPKVSNAVHVYVDGPAGSGSGSAIDANIVRKDVAQAFPIAGPDHGFSAAIGPLSPGAHGIWVYSINTAPGGHHPLLWTATVNVATPASGSPHGSFDSAEGAGAGQARLRGWTVDPDAQISPTDVHVYIDGPAGSGARGIDMGAANKSRPDVGTAFPGVGESHGFEYLVDGLEPGVHAFWVYAINKAGGGENPLLRVLSARVPA